MQFKMLTRFFGNNLRKHSKCFSTSSITYTNTKPSVLLVNHGYPPLFNAGSEVKIKFHLKDKIYININIFRFILKHYLFV